MVAISHRMVPRNIKKDNSISAMINGSQLCSVVCWGPYGSSKGHLLLLSRCLWCAEKQTLRRQRLPPNYYAVLSNDTWTMLVLQGFLLFVVVVSICLFVFGGNGGGGGGNWELNPEPWMFKIQCVWVQSKFWHIFVPLEFDKLFLRYKQVPL